MALITNPKIGYRPFPGFSLLFDNPGKSDFTDYAGKLEIIDCQVEDNPLYAGCAKAMSEIGDWVWEQHGLLPLNPASWHVTAWDGVNAANVEKVVEEHRAEARNLMQGMPFAVRSGNSVIRDVADSELAGWQGAIKYRFDRLAIIADYVLVALLKPADSESETAQRSIEHLREALYSQYDAHYGIGSAGPHMPHVSMGYFLRHEDGRGALDFVNLWNEKFREQLRAAADEVEPTLDFRSIGLYGFSDMERFYRAKQID